LALKSGWTLPGGNRKVKLADGSERTLAELNLIRWQTGYGLAASLLRKHQMPLYEADLSLGEQEVAVQMCSRQFGKSYEKLTLAIETAIQSPNSAIRFAFPSKSQGQEILEGNVRLILATCPPEFAPDVRIESGYIRFHNGSKIVVAGTDDRDQKERLRGTGAKLIIVDEAGSHKDLRYIVDSILGPQLDNHKGRMILITTPPATLDHAFYEYKRDAVIAGKFLKFTILDNTHYTREQKLKICARVNRLPPGHVDAELILDGKMPGNIDWRREYLCEEVADDKLRVTPDFRDEAPFVEAFDRPQYCTHYVFLDQGYHDYFAAVFASHNHAAQKLFVEDVWMGKRMSTDQIVSALKGRSPSGLGHAAKALRQRSARAAAASGHARPWISRHARPQSRRGNAGGRSGEPFPRRRQDRRPRALQGPPRPTEGGHFQGRRERQGRFRPNGELRAPRRLRGAGDGAPPRRLAAKYDAGRAVQTRRQLLHSAHGMKRPLSQSAQAAQQIFRGAFKQ
jgi:hypothetical protein